MAGAWHRAGSTGASGAKKRQATNSAATTQAVSPVARRRWVPAALDVARDRRRTEHGPRDRTGGVREHGASEARQASLCIEQIGLARDTDQRSGGVEEVHDEERDDHADHRRLQRTGDVHRKQRGGGVRWRRHQAVPLRNTERDARRHDAQHADERGAWNAPGRQRNRRAEAEEGKDGRRGEQVAGGASVVGLASTMPALRRAMTPRNRPMPAAIPIFSPVGTASTIQRRTGSTLSTTKSTPATKTAPSATSQGCPSSSTTT